MEKRIIALFAASIFTFAVLQGRLMVLCTNEEYALAQSKQSYVKMPLNDTRGNILDRNYNKITNTTKASYELVCAGNDSYRDTFSRVSQDSINDFFKNTRKKRPFLVEVNSQKKEQSKYVYEGTKRYPSTAIATNIIGYLDASGNGVSGVEGSFNEMLKDTRTAQFVECYQNANGEIIDDIEPKLVEQEGTNESVMLTLDLDMQRICEALAEKSIDKGCIVVLNSQTGRVLASVSKPSFDPNNIVESLNNENAPFINRVISQFAIGSVFKPLLSATALEQNYDLNAEYFCKGYIDINKHIFKCAHGVGHGYVNMTKALDESCNCYFVDLGLKLGAQNIYDMAYAAGFGEATQYCGDTFTSKGNLPSVTELGDVGQLAQLSFGQGALSATPLQIAAFMNIFANNGVYVEPTFVEGIANEKEKTITTSFYSPMQRNVISKENANKISTMLQSVVDNGLGKSAKPSRCTAAGKTGTAQTGKVIEKEDEMNAWFAGYFPAEAPQYTVCVMLDSGTHSSEDACKIFSQLADTFCLFTDKFYTAP